MLLLSGLLFCSTQSEKVSNSQRFACRILGNFGELQSNNTREFNPIQSLLKPPPNTPLPLNQPMHQMAPLQIWPCAVVSNCSKTLLCKNVSNFYLCSWKIKALPVSEALSVALLCWLQLLSCGEGKLIIKESLWHFLTSYPDPLGAICCSCISG